MAAELRGGAGVLERPRDWRGDAGERRRLFGRRLADVSASVSDELGSELLESYREGGRARERLERRGGGGAVAARSAAGATGSCEGVGEWPSGGRGSCQPVYSRTESTVAEATDETAPQMFLSIVPPAKGRGVSTRLKAGCSL